jgi:hypothetical protein
MGRDSANLTRDGYAGYLLVFRQAPSTDIPPADFGQPMKILLVDDEADICKLVKTLVEPLGVEVRTLLGQSGGRIQSWRRDKFDGIMLDVAMPGSGRLRARPARFAPLRLTSRPPSSC